ncbi:hypothetical protein MNBD_ALPHA01-1028 [hydrothermal vent metagenome]|uniref:Cytochrome C oxidase assembly protein n=1 Tax=hydrothermal vent metagenome TaxID=652676 RepID=A0A3B0T571_9ZZZZ
MPLHEEHKKRAGRNYALGAALLAFVLLFFFITLAKLNVI